DYALFHALGVECQCLSSIYLSYNIWCQFSKHLVDHMHCNFPEFSPLMECIQGAVPKMHINGHNIHCQINHSFVYKPRS
ncbi:hypothetical protein P691DRAFT_690828, partial [Macrolepiota fuliginosa MF-IS2]